MNSCIISFCTPFPIMLHFFVRTPTGDKHLIINKNKQKKNSNSNNHTTTIISFSVLHRRAWPVERRMNSSKVIVRPIDSVKVNQSKSANETTSIFTFYTTTRREKKIHSQNTPIYQPIRGQVSRLFAINRCFACLRMQCD